MASGMNYGFYKRQKKRHSLTSMAIHHKDFTIIKRIVYVELLRETVIKKAVRKFG
jgi:aspartate/glutamate racemase